jgi:hypothetical protein
MDNFEQENEATQNSMQPAESTPKKSKKPLFIGIGVVGGGFAIATLLLLTTAPTKLEAAVETCLLEGNSSISLDDDGKGLYIDGDGEENPGLSIGDTVCILRAVEVPDSVTSRMSNTTSLMGQQVADWDDITAMWTYHPNNGLDISLDLK